MVRVTCQETRRCVPSYTAAARELGVSAAAVSRAATTGRSLHGIHFYRTGLPPKARWRVGGSGVSPDPIPVTCVETGVTYPSQGAAARALGLRASNVSSALSRHCAIHGHHFVRTEASSRD